MLTAYGTSKGRLIELSRAAETVIPPDAVWFDLVAPTDAEERALEAFLNIDIPTREELAEIEASSRLYQEDDAAFMTASLIRRADGDRPEASPVTFIIKGKYLVTIRYHLPQAFPAFVARALKPQSTAMTSWGILLSLVEAVVDRAADHLERVGVTIDATLGEIFSTARMVNGQRVRTQKKRTHDYGELLEKVGEEGDFNSKMRESLVSIARMATYMQAIIDQMRQTAEAKENRGRVRTIQRDIASLTDHSSFLSGKISFLLDAVLGMSTIEQNRIIKIFSVASVIFLPPTLVASLYGMNFKYMPELSWHYGYYVAIGLMMLSAFLPWLYFRRKGWL